MKRIIRLFILISTFVINPLLGQEEKLFDTSIEYLSHINKKFKIDVSDIYYLSTESDSLHGRFEKFGIVLLITENQIATINEIADEMGIKCSPKSLMPQITETAIKDASDQSNLINNIILKKIMSGESFKFENRKVAVYTFSFRFGKNADLFLKEKKYLEKLGYKTVVLSIDGAYIKEIIDIDKTPVYVQ